MTDQNDHRVNLAPFGSVVPAGYAYYEKQITPGAPLSLPNAVLKWYDLYPVDAPITADQRDDCRAFLTQAAPAMDLQNNLGFVILHRAGSVLLLLVTTWRETNEMWESVFFKPVDSAAPYAQVPFAMPHRGTFCVWELVAVMHERHAWVRFLRSARDEADKQTYLQDLYEGST